MKKILTILMFVAAFGLVIGCASAAVDLTDHDFDGHFSMKVPKNATFKLTDADNGIFCCGDSYHDSVNNLSATYLMSADVNDSFVDKYVNQFKDKGADVSKKGDLNIIDGHGINVIMFQKDGELLMIESTQLDMDTLTTMAESVKF